MTTPDVSEAERTFVITRSFDVPARFVFLAFSKPEHVMRWFGPVGYPLTRCEMDSREGGRYRFAMTGPDGVENTPFGGTYLKIVPDQEIVYDVAFEAPGAPRMVVSVTLDERAGRTLLTHRTVFESLAMKTEYLGLGFEGGTNSGFDQLAVLVVALRGEAA